MVGEDDSSL